MSYKHFISCVQGEHPRNRDRIDISSNFNILHSKFLSFKKKMNKVKVIRVGQPIYTNSTMRGVFYGLQEHIYDIS